MIALHDLRPSSRQHALHEPQGAWYRQASGGITRAHPTKLVLKMRAVCPRRVGPVTDHQGPDRLLKIVNGGGYDSISESMALNRLRWIERELGANRRVDLPTQAHREHVLFRIESGLDPSA